MGYETATPLGYGYTNPRTGRTYATKALADELDPNPTEIRYSPLTGLPTNQTGSQSWMDATPDGVALPEPSLSEKIAMSSADYAYAWAQKAVAERVATLNNGGQVQPVGNPAGSTIKSTAESPAVTAAERSPAVSAVAAALPSASAVKNAVTAPVILMLAIGLIVAYLIIGALKGGSTHA
jgi:hypothetical protein